MKFSSFYKKNDHGITIVELLVSITVLAVVALMLGGITITALNIANRQNHSFSVESNATLLLKYLSDNALQATNVELSHVFSGTTYSSSSTALVLRLSSLNSSKDIIAGSYDYIAFVRDSTATTTINMVIDAAAGSIRTSGIKTLTTTNQTMTFRYNAQDITTADRVSIYIEQQQTHRSTTLTTKGWTSLFLHNTSN